MRGCIAICLMIFVGFSACRADRNEKDAAISNKLLDTTQFFFSGYLNGTPTTPILRDCATDRDYYIIDNSKKFLSLLTSTSREVNHCIFRGYRVSNRAIVITSFGRFNSSGSCRGLTLSRSYFCDEQILTLEKNYTFSLKKIGSATLNGRWAKLFNNQAVLILKEHYYPFTINYGTRGSEYDIVLSFSNLNNKKLNFIPLNLKDYDKQ